MKTKLENIRNLISKDSVLFGAGIMSVGIFIGSFFNYLTQIFLGRFLSVEDYGVFNSLFSLTVILTIPNVSLLSSMIKIVTDLRNKEDYETLTKIFWRSSTFILIIGLVFVSAIIFFKSYILGYLNIENDLLIYPFSLYILFFLLSTMPKSYLQGLLRYKAFSFHTVAGPVLRLFFTMLFVLLGYGVVGSLLGFSAAAFLSIVIGVVLLMKNFSFGSNKKLNSYYNKFLKFGAAVFVIRTSLTIMSNVDLILVKHFFTANNAGIYSGVVTMGKIILFGTGIVGAVMFPIISDLYTKKVDYYNKFLLFFVTQTLLVIAGIVIFSLYPELIAVTMFGKGYIPAANYIPKFSLFVGLFSIVSFLYQFLLAVEKISAYIILLFSVFAQIVLINLFHSSLDQIININIIVMTTTLLLSLLYARSVFVYNDH